MRAIFIFIIALACILIGDIITGLVLTMLYKPSALQQNVPLDETYLFYCIAAILITIVFTLLQQRKKRATR